MIAPSVSRIVRAVAVAVALGTLSTTGAHAAPVAAPVAVTTAHAFLAAFQQNDLSRAQRLLSPRLRARITPPTPMKLSLPDLLGVQNIPGRTAILYARDEAGSTGPATTVEVELRFASGFIDDSLTMVRLGAGYAVDDITTPDPDPGAARRARGAVTAARVFLAAFRRDDRAAMIGLMSPRLRRANGQQLVSQMLGVQNTPQRIDILDAGSDRNAEGAFTGMGVLLVFAHGTANASLQVIGTPAGYRVDAITHPAPTL